MGPEIWPHEYLHVISPIEITVNWSRSNQLQTRPLYSDFNGGYSYSYSQISGHYEPIHVKFVVWGFSSCSIEIWSWKFWNTKMKIRWLYTSVLYCKDLKTVTSSQNHWMGVNYPIDTGIRFEYHRVGTDHTLPLLKVPNFSQTSGFVYIQ